MSLGEIITGGVGLLTAIGTAGAFIWNKIEGRFKEIDAKLDECEARERDSLDRRAVQLTVIELLWQEVKRHAPASGVLERAKKLLDDLKDQNDEARL